MIPLHHLMDDILIILSDNEGVDLIVVYNDRYYGEVSYEFLLEAVNHLISEGYIRAAEDSYLYITTKGEEFIKYGGYQDKITGELGKRYDERVRAGLDPNAQINRETYLSYMNYPDKLPEIKRSAIRGLWVSLSFMIIIIIFELILHYRK